jgi:hypothetical protein
MLLGFGSFSQKHDKFPKTESVKANAWYTPFVGAIGLPADVYVTRHLPGLGFGSGHVVLFQLDPRNGKRFWLGFDFNRHYFSRRKINDYRLFYEHWQFGPVLRFSIIKHSAFEVFTDCQAGIRTLGSYTTHKASFTEAYIVRWLSIFSKDSNGDLEDDIIVKRYERLNVNAGLAFGFAFWLNKERNHGLTLRGVFNAGDRARYIDRRLVTSEDAMIHYPATRGSGKFFNVQVSYSTR